MTNHEMLKSLSIDDFALFLASERKRMFEAALETIGKEIPPEIELACVIVIRTWLEAEVADNG